jgi:hypothetical protein
MTHRHGKYDHKISYDPICFSASTTRAFGLKVFEFTERTRGFALARRLFVALARRRFLVFSCALREYA